MATRRRAHSPEPNIAAIGALIGDPGRGAMLMALLDGSERAASELALRAGLSPQAATAHLKKLVAGGMLAARDAGRNRFFRLASGEIGEAIEILAAISPSVHVATLAQSNTLERMRLARSCYDHLAGRLGVALTDRLIACRAIAPKGDDFALGAQASAIFGELDIDLEAIAGERRRFARACLDWTERRPHIAGALGAALLELFLRNRWVVRTKSDRSLHITADGTRALAQRFRVNLA